MALILIAHVMALGVLWNRINFRLSTAAIAFVYLTLVYLGVGHFLAQHPGAYTPPETLEDDYYRNPRRTKPSPFLATPKEQDKKEVVPNINAVPDTDEDMDQDRIERLRRQQIQTEKRDDQDPF